MVLMRNLNRLTFTSARTVGGGDNGPLVITPVIDEISLVSRVKEFEEGRSYSPAGAYGGLVPSYFHYGELRKYFLGKEERQWPQPDQLWLLACDCGEVGCWPLAARVIVLNDTVRWTDFNQEHRPDWDYTGFGPFVFAREQYDRAVEWVANEVEAEYNGKRPDIVGLI
jgi:hypothetical protein